MQREIELKCGFLLGELVLHLDEDGAVGTDLQSIAFKRLSFVLANGQGKAARSKRRTRQELSNGTATIMRKMYIQ